MRSEEPTLRTKSTNWTRNQVDLVDQVEPWDP